jgi:hypothetical protein
MTPAPRDEDVTVTAPEEEEEEDVPEEEEEEDVSPVMGRWEAMVSTVYDATV